MQSSLLMKEPTELSNALRGITHVRKPVKQAELHSRILQSLGLAETEQSEPKPGSTRCVQPARILLADDGLVNQKVVIGLLTLHGHEVTVADNERLVVEAWNRGDFDLILKDVQMPEMDGIEATAAIRAKQQSTQEHIPIVAMTAHAI